MEHFIKRNHETIVGTISCFDRILFKGYLPIGYSQAMEGFMSRKGLLLKDFKSFVMKQSQRLKEHTIATAQRAGRPYIYLNSPIRKEERAREIAKGDGIKEGLVCIFSVAEPAVTFKLAYGKGHPKIKPCYPRILCLYWYWMDAEFGLIYIRIQTWFPFTIQIYLNGHEYLARKMDWHNIRYQQVDNAFLGIEDPTRAQRLT